MKGATLCSGIGAPETAMPWMDWQWCAEIDAFPSAVLTARHGKPNIGDMTAPDFVERALENGRPDWMVAGTPCQAFSVAGARKSLDDARGNLTLRFVEIVDAIEPDGILWENVPGVLSTKDNAFGCFLAALAGADAPLVPGPGQRWTDAGLVDGPKRRIAWRVLDAQYFGLAQRRERVFVVACPRDGADPAEILFELEGMQRHSPPSREAGPPVTALTSNGVGTCGADDNQAQGGHLIAAANNTGQGYWTEAEIAGPGPIRCGGGKNGGGESTKSTILAYGGGNCSGPIDIATAQTRHGCRQDFDTETFVTHALPADGFDASEDGTGRGTPPVPVAYRTFGDGNVYTEGDRTAPLTTATDPNSNIVAFSCKDHGADASEIAPTLRSMGHDESHANGGGQVAVALPILEAGARTGASTTDPRAGIGIGQNGDPMYTLQSGKQHAVAFQERGRSDGSRSCDTQEELAYALTAPNGGGRRQELNVAIHMAVRRLTPEECEALQGFPRNYTAITHRGKPAADGPRYKALGNSMAVPVIRWIGERIRRTAQATRLAA